MPAPPWVDLEGPDGEAASIAGNTPEEQARLIVDQQARWKRRTDGVAWAQAIGGYLAAMQNRSADDLQDYGDAALGIPGFPDIGQRWPSDPSQQRIVVHRLLTRSMHNDFVTAHILRVFGLLLRDLVRDSTVDLPDPPELG